MDLIKSLRKHIKFMIQMKSGSTLCSKKSPILKERCGSVLFAQNLHTCWEINILVEKWWKAFGKAELRRGCSRLVVGDHPDHTENESYFQNELAKTSARSREGLNCLLHWWKSHSVQLNIRYVLNCLGWKFNCSDLNVKWDELPYRSSFWPCGKTVVRK